MLRQKIEAILRSSAGNCELAAVEVCVLMEDEIGLHGNGWFDGDDVMERRLTDQEDELDEDD